MTRDEAKRRPALSMINREGATAPVATGRCIFASAHLNSRYTALQINAVEARRLSKRQVQFPAAGFLLLLSSCRMAA
jgi:hypothetical protein